MYKKIVIEGKSFFNALLDTGHLSLMHEDVFKILMLQDYRNGSTFNRHYSRSS